MISWFFLAGGVRIIVIGIVGKTGSGKSTIARYIQKKSKDALVIDGDKVAKEIYRTDPQACRETIKAFKDCALKDHGIDFAALGRKVFSDPAALQRLNSLMFPRLRRQVKRIIRENPDKKTIIIDAAVLWDCGLDRLCDVVLLVKAPKEKRTRFLFEKEPGRKPQELLCRIEGQAIKECPEKADFVVFNEGDREALFAEIDKILSILEQNGP